MSFGKYRFILVKGTGLDSRYIKIRFADNLRANVREDDPARQDDDAFAMLLLETVSLLDDGEDITLNVLPREGETT